MHHRILYSKVFVALTFFALCIPVQAEPYRPYPVIFVHGLNGGAWHWGAALTASEYERLRNGQGGGDLLFVQRWRVMDDHMIDRIWNLFVPYARGDTNFLAAISLDDPAGSIDPGP